MVRYGFFRFNGSIINLNNLAHKLRISIDYPHLLLSHIIVEQVELLVEAELIPYSQLKLLRVLAYTGFPLEESVAIEVKELAACIEKLSENS